MWTLFRHQTSTILQKSSVESNASEWDGWPTRCALSIKMTWDPSECPPSDVCREYYCCHWVEPGGSVDLTGRTYDSIEEAITVRRD